MRIPADAYVQRQTTGRRQLHETIIDREEGPGRVGRRKRRRPWPLGIDNAHSPVETRKIDGFPDNEVLL